MAPAARMLASASHEMRNLMVVLWSWWTREGGRAVFFFGLFGRDCDGDGGGYMDWCDRAVRHVGVGGVLFSLLFSF